MGEKKKEKAKPDEKAKKSKKSKEDEDALVGKKKEKKEKGKTKSSSDDKLAKKDKKEKKDKVKKSDREGKDKRSDKKTKDDKKDKKRKKKKEKGKEKDASGKKKKSKIKGKVETTCCICKEKDADASAGGLCNHVFCLPCLEDMLHKPLKDPQEDDNHLGAPTLGRCPECRAELRKFDMTDTKKGKLKYKRSKGLKNAGIKGKIYRPNDKDSKLPHFCFEEKKPYMNFRGAIAADKNNWILNDGSQVEDKKYFDKGYHWDETTRTFHGTISWKPITFHGAYQWNVVLAFNKELTDIHVGVLHERKDRKLKKKSKVDEDDIARFQYPLDGQWKLLWKTPDGNPQTGSITVSNNEFQQGPYLFNINFADPAVPKFRWPLDPVYATAKSGVNLKKKPLGPKVGDRVVWETTHPAFAEITWERESIGGMPIQRTQHFGVSGHAYTAIAAKDKKKSKEEKPPKKKKSGDSSAENVDGGKSKSKAAKGGAEKTKSKSKGSDEEKPAPKSEPAVEEKPSSKSEIVVEEVEKEKPPSKILVSQEAENENKAESKGKVMEEPEEEEIVVDAKPKSNSKIDTDKAKATASSDDKDDDDASTSNSSSGSSSSSGGSSSSSGSSSSGSSNSDGGWSDSSGGSSSEYKKKTISPQNGETKLDVKSEADKKKDDDDSSSSSSGSSSSGSSSSSSGSSSS